MNRITVSKTRDYLVKDNKPFFYFADTAWAALYALPQEYWAEYLDYRKEQGFNALQLLMLPVTHDASEAYYRILPFELGKDGKFDYGRVNGAYFDRACTMLEMAQVRGFTPVIAPLWYASIVPGANAYGELPLEKLDSYLAYVVGRLDCFNPIYIVTGDTRFSEQEMHYYRQEIQTLKRLSPACLTAVHGNPHINIPDELLYNPLVDIVLYQSGHGVNNGVETQKLPYVYAKLYSSKGLRRPVINGEPCYEGSGHAYTYGRFGAFDVRKALWQSILSGAKAGFTYGAHGIWSWHRKGDSFSNEEFMKMPFDWRDALRFPGAWDAAFAKWVFETYCLFDMVPKECVLNKTEEIRVSVSTDGSRFAAYVPHNVDVLLDIDISSYDCFMIELETRRVAKPEVCCENGSSLIKMHRFNADVVIIGIDNCNVKFLK